MEATTSAGSKKGYKGFSMEGPIARWYARITGKDLADVRRLAKELAGRVAEGGSVIEVAPGPGYLAIELAKLGARRITGLDISRSFVRMATENAARAGVSVTFLHGDVAMMPFDPDSFDLLVCRAAFKNFPEPVRALDEMHRVLRPGGEALIIDLRSDASPSEIDTHVDRMGLGPINALVTKLIFKHGLLKWAYSPAQFRSMAAASRFGSCAIQESSIGLEVSLRK